MILRLKLLLLLFMVLPFFGVAQEAKSLTFTPIADNVFMHTSYQVIEGYGQVGSHGLILIEDNSAYLIDTPWTNQDTEKLHRWLSSKKLNLVMSISTHSHQDRVGGLAYLNKQGIKTLVFDKTQAILRDQNKVLASHTFSSETYSLLNNKIKLYYPGAGHSTDNIVVFLPEQKLLFGGCLIRGNGWLSLGNTHDADVEQWAKSVGNVKRVFGQVNLVVPGHGKIGDQGLLDHTIFLVNQQLKQHSNN